MTRINIIPPTELADQHLIAEIKEINQLAGSFRKSLNSKNGIKIDKIPKEFTLNKGHVTFFYNKGMYLKLRFEWLKQEAIKRGFKIKAVFQNEWETNHKPDLFCDWVPSDTDKEIIRERIAQKKAMKPNYYRYYKKLP